jgi:subtilisin-like proprotein convertase family protein
MITIPWAGASTPYPSTIRVSRLGSATSNVSVNLNRLKHDWYDDIDILLAGPEGQSVLLMSDAGDSCNRETNLTFNDRSPALPDFGCPFASDAYRPSNYETYPDNFPAPAPAPPYSDHLSAFNSTDPNGTWSLYVVDDYGIFTGRISGGWCLNIMVNGSR